MRRDEPRRVAFESKSSSFAFEQWPRALSSLKTNPSEGMKISSAPLKARSRNPTGERRKMGRPKRTQRRVVFLLAEKVVNRKKRKANIADLQDKKPYSAP